MPIRAIATDLDGTLLRSDKSVSPRTRDAVHAAEDAGLLVVIATGRPPRWIPPIVEELGERGLVVCANGASIYDPERHELIEQITMSPELLHELVDDLEAAFPEAIFGVEQGFEFAIDEIIPPRGDELKWGGDAIRQIRVGPIRTFFDQPAVKLTLRLPYPAPDGSAARAQSVVGERATVTHSTSEAFLEVSHRTVHKGLMVERVLERSGIAAAEVVAFGDMPNDIELIRWAGHGVAVGNADQRLKDAADEVTATNDEDGVAIVIERVLAERAP
jgi:hydroxymethylpyrimidine pyrophosphatase-like HAD family hydrolase